jgi:hypothetical protein
VRVPFYLVGSVHNLDPHDYLLELLGKGGYKIEQL